MGAASVVTAIMKSSPYLTRMSISLFWIYLTLGRRVGKTRKAFERQLIQQGMSREDATRVSICFEDLKNNITGMLRQGIRLGGARGFRVRQKL
jgi:hypothetical protein